ncbi:DUF4391 domain-containing protein [Candidatus Saccharibacteria bacterium]|nr:DUF4391 domain-containing protein [Candidatus Saccharibacteria bacterium]
MIVQFPAHARVGKIVAKENFYGNIDNSTKNLFQDEIARIIWEYKLAPETINLSAKNWQEIEVFIIMLKNSSISEKILKTIDSVIPYPILFLVESGSLEKAIICFKEQNQKDENFAKVDTYFATEWNDKRLENIKIDGLNIDAVFNNFVRQVAGNKLSRDAEKSSQSPSSIKEDIEKLKEREKIQKQIDVLTRRIKLEPSIGKKQELAEERFRLKQLILN